MEWQTIINWGGTAVMMSIGWFCRQIWDSVKDLKEDVKQIEVDLPTHYVRKDELATRFDKLEETMTRGFERLFDKLETKQDKTHMQ